MVIISQRCFYVPALLSSKITSCKALGFGRDVVSLPLTCYLQGEALLGPNGTEGGCLLRLPTMSGPRALTSLGPVKSPKSKLKFSWPCKYSESPLSVGSHLHSDILVIIPYYLVGESTCLRCLKTYVSVFSCFLQKDGSE